MRALRELSARHAAQLETPVPLSDNALEPVQALVRELQVSGELTVKKVIAESICFDTNRVVDKGWLEPLPADSAVYPRSAFAALTRARIVDSSAADN